MLQINKEQLDKLSQDLSRKLSKLMEIPSNTKREYSADALESAAQEVLEQRRKKANSLKFIQNFLPLDFDENEVATQPPHITTYKSIKPSKPLLIVPIHLNMGKDSLKPACIICNLPVVILGNIIEPISIHTLCDNCADGIIPFEPTKLLYTAAGEGSVIELLHLYRMSQTSNKVKRIDIPNFRDNLGKALLEVIKKYLKSVKELTSYIEDKLEVNKYMISIPELQDIIVEITKIILQIINKAAREYSTAKTVGTYQECLMRVFSEYQYYQLEMAGKRERGYFDYNNELSYIIDRIMKCSPHKTSENLLHILAILLERQVGLITQLGKVVLVDSNYRKLIQNLDVKYLLPAEISQYNSMEGILLSLFSDNSLLRHSTETRYKNQLRRF